MNPEAGSEAEIALGDGARAPCALDLAPDTPHFWEALETPCPLLRKPHRILFAYLKHLKKYVYYNPKCGVLDAWI